MAFSLTAEQQAVVDNRGGGLLVSAAAGSGKTRVLVERLLDRVIREEAEKRGAGPGMDPLAAACEKYKQKKGYGGKQI